MGNRAQVRVTLGCHSIDVCDRHGGSGMALQVHAAVTELAKAPLRHDMQAAYVLGHLLAPRHLGPLQVNSLWVDFSGGIKYGADNRGFEVDLDSQSVRLFDDDFENVLAEWDFPTFAALDIKTPDGYLWIPGIDPPDEENDVFGMALVSGDTHG